MFGLEKTQEDTMAFFDCISERKLTDAERILASLELGIVFYRNQIDQSYQKSKKAVTGRTAESSPDYAAGYVKALEGMLAAAKSSDERTFLNRASQDPEVLKTYRRKFIEFNDEKIHSTFDRGFFSAWLDFINHRMKTLEAKKDRSSMR